MSNINKQELRLTAEKAKDNFIPNFMVPTRDVLALLDELEAKDRRNAELNSTLERWAVDRAQSASELEAAEKRIAEQRELLRWAHETLLEINPSNYTHDDVCEANAAAVDVILCIAPTLGETHGHTNEWWAARSVATGKGD